MKKYNVADLNKAKRERVFPNSGAKRVTFTCPICDHSWEEKTIFPTDDKFFTERKCDSCHQIGIYMNEDHDSGQC